MFTAKQGEFLVKLARSAIKACAENNDSDYEKGEKWLDEKRGTFTSIHTYPGNDLRGCVGFPMPDFPIGKAVIESARHACHDDRFEPIGRDELGRITIEVSVLSVPEELKFSTPDECIKKINKNQGFIIRHGHSSGLFLPQVWEQLHGKEEFLDHLCMKAFLPKGTWKKPGTKLFSFTAQVFKEEKPSGKVVEVME